MIGVILCLHSIVPDVFSEEKTQDKALLEIHKLAKQTKIVLLDEDGQATPVATLVDKPLIRYVDKTRGINSSTMWLWLNGQRPVAFQKIEEDSSQANMPRWTYCVSSSADQPLQISWRGVRNPFFTTAIKYRSIPNAPLPAETQRSRQFQMRGIARKIVVTEYAGRAEERQQKLRLMPKPLYEFRAVENGVLSGAVFGYAVGTNPDLLLIIQLSSRGGEPRWEYAPVRMTSGGLSVSYQQKELWREHFQFHPGDYKTWAFFHTPRIESQE